MSVSDAANPALADIISSHRKTWKVVTHGVSGFAPRVLAAIDEVSCDAALVLSPDAVWFTLQDLRGLLSQLQSGADAAILDAGIAPSFAAALSRSYLERVCEYARVHSITDSWALAVAKYSGGRELYQRVVRYRPGRGGGLDSQSQLSFIPVVHQLRLAEVKAGRLHPDELVTAVRRMIVEYYDREQQALGATQATRPEGVAGRLSVLLVCQVGGVGGVHTSVLRLALSLRRTDARVAIVAPSGSWLIGQGASAGIVVIPVDHCPWLWLELSRARDLIERWKPDVVHCEGGNSNAFLMAAAGSRVPRLQVVREAMAASYLECVALAGYSVVPSRFVRSELIASGWPESRVEVVYDGVAIADTGVDSNGDVVHEAGPVIGFVGRCTPQKRLELWVQAVAMIRRDLPTAKCRAVGDKGDGAYWGQIEAHARDVGVPLEYVGFTDDTRAVYQSLDAVVCLGTREALGNVALEAMAAGLPFVCADDGGTQELLPPSLAWLACSPNPSAVAECLRRLFVQDECARVSAVLRHHVEESFSEDEMAARFLDVYGKLQTRATTE